MAADLTDFIRNVFKKQPISFKYKDQPYRLTLYAADVNNKIAAEYFLHTVNETVKLVVQEDPRPIEQLMKLYMRLQSSAVLKTRVPRVIKRGNRKFDVRTLASRTSEEKKFNEHITFASLPYPNNLLDASERYKYIIDKTKLQAGTNLDTDRLFEKAIYVKDVLNTEINEDEYYNYVETILQKLDKWEKKETALVEERTREEEELILSGRGGEIIREFHDRYLEEFINEITNPLFKKLFYELEGLYYWFWENIFLSVFVRINSSMSETEKKAYLLFYSRQNYLDFHLPAFEQLTLDFFETLSEEEKAELIYTLLINKIGGGDAVAKAYDTRFMDFLRFYPLWLNIVHLDENMNDDEFSVIRYNDFIPKQRPTGTIDGKIQKTTFESLFEFIKTEKKDSDTLEESIPVEDEQFKRYDSAHLLHLVNTQLSKKEREAVEQYYLGEEEDAQVTVSKNLGISQSALNQRLKSAIIKLKKLY